MLIRGLVHADSLEEALATAKDEVFTPLVDRGTFDYYTTFDMDGGGVAGADRWGRYPAVVRADQPSGRELIRAGWEKTVEEYDTSFDEVEAFFDQHDRPAFWEDGDVHAEYCYAFHAIGEFAGPHTYLYDEAGQGVRDRGHLRLLESGYEELADETTKNPYQDMDLYVVPADVHY